MQQALVGLLITAHLTFSGFIANKLISNGEELAGLTADVTYLKTKTLDHLPRETADLRFHSVEGRLTKLEKYADKLYSRTADSGQVFRDSPRPAEELYESGQLLYATNRPRSKERSGG
jgi:hypothetical protein